jgi:hypothetical protein
MQRPYHEKNLLCDKNGNCPRNEPDTICKFAHFTGHAISSRLTNANNHSSLLQAQKFIAAYSAFLKRQGKLPIPGWVDTVKTSASNELPPQDQDW